MNPALESTYAFVERVLADLVAIHREAGVPLLHLHMGGDEVQNGVWRRSPVAQAFLKQEGLASVDDLWFVFYGRVEEILQSHGIPLSGWEEIAVRKTKRDGQDVLIPNPEFAARGWRAYVWNNVPGWGAEDLAYRLANGGYQVVLHENSLSCREPRGLSPGSGDRGNDTLSRNALERSPAAPHERTGATYQCWARTFGHGQYTDRTRQ